MRERRWWIPGAVVLLAPALGTGFENKESTAAGGVWLRSAAGPQGGDFVLAATGDVLVRFDDGVFAAAGVSSIPALDVAISPDGRVAVATTAGVLILELVELEAEALGGPPAPAQLIALGADPVRNVEWLDAWRVLAADDAPAAWVLDADLAVVEAGPLAMTTPAADVIVAPLDPPRGFLLLEDGTAAWIDAGGSALDSIVVAATNLIAGAVLPSVPPAVAVVDSSGTLVRIDPAVPSVSGTAVLGGTPVRVVATGGGKQSPRIAVVESAPAPRVQVFDDALAAVGTPIPIPDAPADAVATADGRVLIADIAGDVHAYRDGPWVEIVWFSPAVLTSIDESLLVKATTDDADASGTLSASGQELATVSASNFELVFSIPGDIWGAVLPEGTVRLEVVLQGDPGARDAIDMEVDAALPAAPIVDVGFGDERIVVEFQDAFEAAEEYAIYYGVGSAMDPISLPIPDPFVVAAPAPVGTSGGFVPSVVRATIEGVPNGTELCVYVAARDASGRESDPPELPVPPSHCATASRTRGVASADDAGGFLCTVAPVSRSVAARGMRGLALLGLAAAVVVFARRRSSRGEQRSLLGAGAILAAFACPGAADASERARFHGGLGIGAVAPSDELFEQVYGDEARIEVMGRLGWTPISQFAIGLEGGYARFSGNRVSEANPALSSSDRSLLRRGSVLVTATLRGELGEGQWVVPYLGGGAGLMFWQEVNLADRTTFEGDRPGFVGFAGVQFLLDAIEPRAAKELEKGWGIRDTYLCLEVVQTSNTGDPVMSTLGARAAVLVAF